VQVADAPKPAIVFPCALSRPVRQGPLLDTIDAAATAERSGLSNWRRRSSARCSGTDVEAFRGHRQCAVPAMTTFIAMRSISISPSCRRGSSAAVYGVIAQVLVVTVSKSSFSTDVTMYELQTRNPIGPAVPELPRHAPKSSRARNVLPSRCPAPCVCLTSGQSGEEAPIVSCRFRACFAISRAASMPSTPHARCLKNFRSDHRCCRHRSPTHRPRAARLNTRPCIRENARRGLWKSR